MLFLLAVMASLPNTALSILFTILLVFFGRCIAEDGHQHRCMAFPNRFSARVNTIRTSSNRFLKPVEVDYFLYYDRYLKRERKDVLDEQKQIKEIHFTQDIGLGTVEFAVKHSRRCLRSPTKFFETTHWPHTHHYIRHIDELTVDHNGLKHHFKNVLHCCNHNNPAKATVCSFFQDDVPVLVSYDVVVDGLTEHVDMHFLKVDKQLHIDPTLFDIPDICFG